MDGWNKTVYEQQVVGGLMIDEYLCGVDLIKKVSFVSHAAREVFACINQVVI